MMVTFGTYSWVNAILNTSLLLYYIFAAVAKWEDDKCNYQLFLWRFLQMQETFTKRERGYAMTVSLAQVQIFIFHRSRMHLV